MALLDDFVANSEQLVAIANAYAASGSYDPGMDHIVRTARPWVQTLATALAQVNVQRPPPPPPEPVAAQGGPTPIPQTRRRA